MWDARVLNVHICHGRHQRTVLWSGLFLAFLSFHVYMDSRDWTRAIRFTCVILFLPSSQPPIYGEREKEHKVGWVVRWGDLGVIEEGEYMIKIYYKRNFFPIKKRKRNCLETKTGGKNNVESNWGRYLTLTSSLHMSHTHVLEPVHLCVDIYTYLKNIDLKC